MSPDGFWRRRMLARVPLLVLVVLTLGPGTSDSVQAQPATRLQRIGWLDTWDAAGELYAPLVRALEQLGHKRGRSFSMVVRQAEYRLERLPELARLLVHERPDVIVALGDPAIAACRAATGTIPIVMIASVDAVKAGHVRSLARPGGNVTGLSNLAAPLAATQVNFLKEAVPRLARLAVLKYPAPHLGDLLLPEIRARARAAGVSLTVRDVRDRKDLEQAFEALKEERAEAVLLLGGGVLDGPAQIRAGQLGLRHLLPVASDTLLVTFEGGLMSYNASASAQIQRAAYYVDRILNGSRPADLPVEEPREFDLVVNAETAKKLEIRLSPTLLLRATRVIE